MAGFQIDLGTLKVAASSVGLRARAPEPSTDGSFEGLLEAARSHQEPSQHDPRETRGERQAERQREVSGSRTRRDESLASSVEEERVPTNVAAEPPTEAAIESEADGGHDLSESETLGDEEQVIVDEQAPADSIDLEAGNPLDAGAILEGGEQRVEPTLDVQPATLGSLDDASNALDVSGLDVASLASEPLAAEPTPKVPSTELNDLELPKGGVEDAGKVTVDLPPDVELPAGTGGRLPLLKQDVGAQAASSDVELLSLQRPVDATLELSSESRANSPTTLGAEAEGLQATDSPRESASSAQQHRFPEQLLARVEQGGENATAKAGVLEGAQQGRFVERVARAFQAAQGRGGTIRLRLHPPELGAVRIDLRVENGALTARLEAETATARSALWENLPQLRDRLQEQGVRIEQFEVDLSDRQNRSATADTFQDSNSGDGTNQRSESDAEEELARETLPLRTISEVQIDVVA